MNDHKIDPIESATRWTQEPFDAATRQEVQQLIDADDTKALNDRFGMTLAFGTAGLRGIMGAGNAMMNEYTLTQAARGLGEYLAEHPQEGLEGVVVGFDGRYNSRRFGQLTAQVLCECGIKVYLFKDVAPTPLIPFTLRRLKASAGVVVTSSHNSKEYNGFKVYAANGAQIISPVDEEIAARMAQWQDRVPPRMAIDAAKEQGLWVELGDADEEAYLDWVVQTATPRKLTKITGLFTPLAGAGGRFVRRAFEKAGFSKLHCYEPHMQPDPEFAGLPAPNPEHPENWLDALNYAEELGVDVAIANDGDADRIGIAVRNSKGELELLSGNQIGVLILYYLLMTKLEHGERIDNQAAMCSVVSSPLTRRTAEGLGARFYETLTGFKWMGNLAEELSDEGISTFFAFEEAFGVTFGDSRDKDGITSAVLLAEIAAWAKSRQLDLFELIHEIYLRFGIHLEGAAAAKYPGVSGKQKIADLIAKLRQNPPSEIAEDAVVLIKDYAQGLIIEDGKSSKLEGFPPQNLLRFELASGAWVAIRPSGTEPKVKAYVGVVKQSSAESFTADMQMAQLSLKKLEAAAAELLAE